MQAKKTTKKTTKKATKKGASKTPRKRKKPAEKKPAHKKRGARQGAAKSEEESNVVTLRPSEEAKAQQEIPGTERLVDMEIEDLAEQLYDVRTRRMELTKQETLAASCLLTAMKDKGQTLYISEELKLRVEVVSASERVKLKKYTPEEPDA